jgi:exodeoxyribonuclease VII large subunit
MPTRSVSEVTQHIKAHLDNDAELADLWVAGEVSGFQRAASGHCYFSLKDSESELRCVMWRSQVLRLPWLPQNGDQVEAHGYISVYERSGAYQFYTDAFLRGGVGARWRELEATKARLQAEGLFDEARKRPLPRWPRRIGIVTSPSGAALQDMLRTLEERYPLVEVVLSPSLVQGTEAPAALLQALARLHELPDVDVIIIARGGGSQEDLWAFNDEALARAVAASRVPVVSGVGHEVDFTIVDFVADQRAPTPTAAAALVVPDRTALRRQLQEGAQALVGLMAQRLEHRRAALQQGALRLRPYDPRRRLDEQRQRVDDLLRRGSTAWEHALALRRATVAGAQGRLPALSPLGVLERGYAIVRDGRTGVAMVRASQAQCGQAITIQFHDGRLAAQVMSSESTS